MTDWQLLSVRTDASHCEIIADYLWSIGVAAIEQIDNGDEIELRTSVGVQSSEIAATLNEKFPTAQVSQLLIDRGVSDTWRQHVQPVWVDESLVIVPSWLTVESEDLANNSPTVAQVLIDPEDVFGLGNHPTTMGALILARRHVAAGSQLFDYGAGSGVLGIAMAKTHQCDVSAYDIAVSSAEVVFSNAQRNGVSVKWFEITEEQFESKFDVVLANILAPVLIEISDNIARLLRVGGMVILSGMREEQWASVQTHYGHMQLTDSITIDGWLSVALQS